MLAVILRGKGLPAVRGNLAPPSLAPVDARVLRRAARVRENVEDDVFGSGQEFSELIKGHRLHLLHQEARGSRFFPFHPSLAIIASDFSINAYPTPRTVRITHWLV